MHNKLLKVRMKILSARTKTNFKQELKLYYSSYFRKLPFCFTKIFVCNLLVLPSVS